MTLTLKDLQVLAAVRRLGKDAYAAQIVRDLTAEGLGSWDDTAFYRVAKRLTDSELIRSENVEHKAKGRTVRLFALTRTGNKKLEKLVTLLWRAPEGTDDRTRN